MFLPRVNTVRNKAIDGHRVFGGAGSATEEQCFANILKFLEENSKAAPAGVAAAAAGVAAAAESRRAASPDDASETSDDSDSD